jgi:hypothetical protein
MVFIGRAINLSFVVSFFIFLSYCTLVKENDFGRQDLATKKRPEACQFGMTGLKQSPEKLSFVISALWLNTNLPPENL